MPKFFISDEQIKKDKIYLIGEDVNHIKNVLRSKIGEKIEICDSEHLQDYECKILELKKEEVICQIIRKKEENVESNIEVTIFQGLPKADKMELIIQKAVELGVTSIVPTEMKRCIVKLETKDKLKKIQRWQKIAEVASKQCGRSQIPVIQEVTNEKIICQEIEQYDIVLVAYEKEENNSLKKELKILKEMCKTKEQKIKIGIIIGPEGGIASEEIKLLEENGAKVITLGKRILRTETVAFHMLSIIMYELEE